MNLDPCANRDPADVPGDTSPPPLALHLGAAWHRPLITIMNMKRTMFFAGSFPDGGIGTTGS